MRGRTSRQIVHRARERVQARRPLRGADRVARRLVGFPAEPEPAALAVESAVVDGELGVLAALGGRPSAGWGRLGG